MGAAPDVSVVVPCYNGERYLDQCLGSIEQNSQVSLEILAVNDGSKDASLKIMEAHAARDARVRVIDKPNSGYGASVNRGLDEARGRFVAIVECDDYVRPGFYDEAVAFAARFEAPQVVKTPYVRLTQPDTPRERALHCKYFGLVHDLGRTFALAEQPLLIHYHPSIWSALYERAFLLERGIRMREVPGAGWVDNPFLLETMLQAERICYLEKEFYCYREDAPGSSSVGCDPQIPIARWNDMQDVVERLGVTDPQILATHVWHAFAFVGGFAHEGMDETGEPYASVKALFGRIDPALVWDNPYVSNAAKRFFAKTRGLAAPRWNRGAHAAQVAREVLDGIRFNGPGFFGAYLDSFLARRR